MRSFLNRCRRGHTAAAAYTALFLALGGTAYAIDTITSEDIVDETIQSQDIAGEAVTTADLGKRAVTLDRMHDYSVNGAKVVDNSLSSSDIANGSLNSWDVANDSLTGGDLNIDVKTVYASTNEQDPIGNLYYSRRVSVPCPLGYTLLGGGATIRLDGIGDDRRQQLENKYDLVESSPKIYVSSPYEQMGWTARAVADDFHFVEPEQFRLEVFARCAAL